NDRLKTLRKAMTTAQGEERFKIKDQITELERRLPPHPPTIPGIHNDWDHRTEIHVLRRGEWEKKAEMVAPRPLSILSNDQLPELRADDPEPRTQLARWITNPNNPLVARVIVNRLWQNHFGLGLVKTPNDFGHNGDRPSHPELLDWLASQLASN